MKRHRMITISSILLLSIIAFGAIFTRHAKFGKAPSGERLEKIKKSPNYKDGQFQNLSSTPMLADDASYFGVLKDALFGRSPRRSPELSLPSKKSNLLALKPDENILVWFGHSSYFLQIDGKKILIDPVLSGAASPVSFTMKSYDGSDVYTPDDIPEIDYLFITHDHWDHLDYETLIKLKPKIKKIITGLGVGENFELWGFDKNIIIEKDWYESETLDSGFTVNICPTQHFSGRSFKRNLALWASFALQTPTMKLYFGGDSGYDTHFANIGSIYGPFDLAILECGQYNKSWKIHMAPEETIQAAIDLKAKRAFPGHWSKFSLSLHSWDEPIIRASEEAKKKNMPLLTPMIGEAVNLNDTTPSAKWWENAK